MIRRPRILCVLFALLLFWPAAFPQAHAQTAVYGQFSASHFNTLPNVINEWGYGGGFGLYSDF